LNDLAQAERKRAQIAIEQNQRLPEGKG